MDKYIPSVKAVRFSDCVDMIVRHYNDGLCEYRCARDSANQLLGLWVANGILSTEESRWCYEYINAVL